MLLHIKTQSTTVQTDNISVYRVGQIQTIYQYTEWAKLDDANMICHVVKERFRQFDDF